MHAIHVWWHYIVISGEFIADIMVYHEILAAKVISDNYPSPYVFQDVPIIFPDIFTKINVTFKL